MSLRVLSAEDVRAAVPMAAAISAVREAFLALESGEFDVPVRGSLGDGRFLTMTALHRPSATTVVKAVSLIPGRAPVVAGSVAFLESTTSTTTVLDAAAVTALRTGAVSGVATDALAAPDASRLVLVGLGGQAPDQLRAVRAVRPIDSVVLVSRNRESAASFRDRCGPELDGLAVEVMSDLDSAVGAADVICCATPATAPLFAAAALPDRVHINAVGSYRHEMRELPDELVATSAFVVDQLEAALEESGELHHALRAGLITVDHPVELGALLEGAAAVPLGGRTVFKSVGLAIQDWAIGHAATRSGRCAAAFADVVA